MQNLLLQLEIGVQKHYSTMKTSFILHPYINKDGEQQIFFQVRINNVRKKIPSGYYCKSSEWNAKKLRHKNNQDINIVLENMLSKATEIRTFYRLTLKELSMDNFIYEFFKKTPSYDFLAYFENQMNIRVTNTNTLKKHKSVLKKLKDYRDKLPFTELSLDFFSEYRNYMFQLGNNKSTRNSNIKVIKYYLLYAQKSGVIFNFNLADLEVGSCSGNRTSISLKDTQRLYEIYFLNILTENQQLSLGYFLISCLTSLRVSDIFETKRHQFLSGEIYFKSTKTQKQTTLVVIPEALKIVKHNPKMFSKKISQQSINANLKEVAKLFKIQKRITMHVGRHTFATNFLKAGGTVQDLQIILDHSSIETTMIYVHMDKEEAINSMSLLSQFFK